MTGPGPARQAQNGEGTKILLSQNEEPGTKHQEHNNMQIQRFEDIEAWQLGRELTRLVYQITQQGNFVRDFGLKDQIQRASGSIMHNIAEGFDGGSNKEFIKFLRYSQRSCAEVQSELYVALDQRYLDSDQFQRLYDLAAKVHSKVGAFIAYLLRSERTH